MMKIESWRQASLEKVALLSLNGSEGRVSVAQDCSLQGADTADLARDRRMADMRDLESEAGASTSEIECGVTKTG